MQESKQLNPQILLSIETWAGAPHNQNNERSTNNDTVCSFVFLVIIILMWLYWWYIDIQKEHKITFNQL